MRLTKTQRRSRDKIIQDTKQASPELTLQELADLFGLKSRSHAHWILKKWRDGNNAQIKP